jgi:hypothetical protein
VTGFGPQNRAELTNARLHPSGALPPSTADQRQGGT